MMTTSQMAADLADVFPDHLVTETPGGWIDIHVHTDRALRDGLDFVRIEQDDVTYRVLTLTHNGVVRGEAVLSGTMTGLLVAVVREILEAM